MTLLKKNSITVAAAFLFSSLTGLIPYQHQQLHFTADAGGAYIDYDQTENTITIACDASFLDVVDTVSDRALLEELGDGRIPSEC